MEIWTGEDLRKQEGFVACARHYQADVCDEMGRQVRRLRAELAGVEQSLNALTENMSRTGSTRRLLHRISGRRNRAIQLRGQIERLIKDLAPLDQTVELLRAQYRSMRAIPRVKDVFTLDYKLIALTEALYGKDQDGQWHRVGRLRIEIDLVNLRDQSAIMWTNLDGPRVGYQAPPNISVAGRAGCIGTALNPLVRAMEQRDYATILSIAVRYPECAGDTDLIAHWPSVRIDDVPEWYLVTFGR